MFKNTHPDNIFMLKDQFAVNAKTADCQLESFSLQEMAPETGIFRRWLWPVPQKIVRTFMKNMSVEENLVIGLCIDEDEYRNASMMGYECEQHFNKSLTAIVEGKCTDVPVFILAATPNQIPERILIYG